jgi:tetratricopeptide (TPR) repeat protein
MGIISYVLCGRHHGKGIKYSRRNEHEKALRHYMKSLKHAIRSKNDGMILLATECVATTLFKLKFYDEALLYTEQYFDRYKEIGYMGTITESGAQRVSALVEKINSEIKKNDS